MKCRDFEWKMQVWRFGMILKWIFYEILKRYYIVVNVTHIMVRKTFKKWNRKREKNAE